MTHEAEGRADLEPVETVKKLPALAIDRVGQILPRDTDQVNTLAQYMAKTREMIPAHLRNNPAMCMGIIYDAVQWNMNPFRLATQHMVVNGVGSYMSQAITAIVNQSKNIKGRLVPRYEGEGDKRRCILKPVAAEDGQELPYESPEVGKITPKNSPLWKSDPDQQLFYYSSRAWTRRYFPDLLMGVYDDEEARSMKNITPSEPVDNFLEDEVPPKEVTGEVLPPAVEHKRAVAMAMADAKEAERVEIRKAQDDMVAFGTGAVLVTPEGTTHVPIEEVVITPDLIAANLEKAIKNHSDKRALERWQHDMAADLNGLPPELSKRVRKALFDRHLELEDL